MSRPQLRGGSIDAVAGWQYVPTDRTPDEATMRAAVPRAGADPLLIARLTGFNTETDYTMAAVTVAAGPGLYEGWYGPADVTYKMATIYTTLFDVRSARQVWTFTAPTYDPAMLRQDAPRYASDVTGMLRSSGLVAAR